MRREGETKARQSESIKSIINAERANKTIGRAWPTSRRPLAHDEGTTSFEIAKKG